MNITTGNLYLQAYNNQSGKFIEVPSTESTIVLYSGPTGRLSRPWTSNFNGFLFSRPIRTSSIEMLPISIGTNNVTGSGVYNVNIGAYNINALVRPDLITGNTIGSHNIGFMNYAIDSTNSYNFGSRNTLRNSINSYILGSYSLNSGSFRSFDLGYLNTLQTGTDCYLIGKINYLDSGDNLISIGSNNIQTVVTNSLNLGSSNNIYNSDQLSSFGNAHQISGSSKVYNIGENNISTNNNLLFLFGKDNNFTNSANQICIGHTNTSNSGALNLVFGKNNLLDGTGNHIFGEGNIVNGSYGKVNGKNNTIYSSSQQDIVFGDLNNLDGTTNNSIIGSNNSSNGSLYIPYISGIFITGSYGETKLDRINLTGANATGFFKYIANTVGNNLYTGFTFNGLYTTTDFITYSKNLGMGLTNSIYGRINYDSQNLYGNGNAWILTLDLSNDVGGTYPAYSSYNLTAWSGLGNILGTTYRFTPNPTGRLSGYINDNVNGFYNRENNRFATTFNNTKGHTITYDIGTGWSLYYNNVRTGNLSTIVERIYSGIDGANFTGWSGLKSYNSGSLKIATGITYLNTFNPIGGNSNFYVGNNNITTLNSFSYSFGDGNTLYNNVNSYAIGRSNILEDSISCYAFGELNTVSGFQNCVIGNNNEIRSGDYNSIFIGINYTPTGDDKVATISLATVNNKIEISPSEIRLDSANRPKINGENIIIQSEFDTISNALVPNGSASATNTFQDPYYDKLADRISISGFTYDSGAYTSLVSNSQEFGGTSTLFLNNFNIYSTTSYTGSNGFNIIYGNHTRSQFSPAWIVVDSNTSGIYYKNDITPYNRTPQTGWYVTGFNDGTSLYTGISTNFGADLVMGTRQGYISVSNISLGTVYLPYFY
jgi:hypothetical protein